MARARAALLDQLLMTAALPAICVVMALRAESDGVFEAAGVPVLYCGVGKVNAAMSLTRELCRYAQAAAVPLVLNFGTAGSRCHAAGEIVACHKFVQRDMDVRALGFELGVTPFDPTPAKLEFEPLFPQLPAAVCETGDSFAAGAVPLGAEHGRTVLDMEAYALAKVCLLMSARFGSVKYVTDGANAAAARDWQDNVHGAARAFLDLYRVVQSTGGHATL